MIASKKIINLAIEKAYINNSFDYLGVCDGGKEGQVVYMQVYDNDIIETGRKSYVFYGYDRYKVGEANGQVIYDSADEETWREVYFDKGSAVKFALSILKDM